MVEPSSIEQSIRMREEIHALSMKTFSPEEWAAR
jgi:acid stress-induced BolA-like protein IbaG/YrbA